MTDHEFLIRLGYTPDTFRGSCYAHPSMPAVAYFESGWRCWSGNSGKSGIYPTAIEALAAWVESKLPRAVRARDSAYEALREARECFEGRHDEVIRLDNLLEACRAAKED